MEQTIHNLINFDHTYVLNYPTVMFSTQITFATVAAILAVASSVQGAAVNNAKVSFKLHPKKCPAHHNQTARHRRHHELQGMHRTEFDGHLRRLHPVLFVIRIHRFPLRKFRQCARR